MTLKRPDKCEIHANAFSLWLNFGKSNSIPGSSRNFPKFCRTQLAAFWGIVSSTIPHSGLSFSYLKQISVICLCGFSYFPLECGIFSDCILGQPPLPNGKCQMRKWNLHHLFICIAHVLWSCQNTSLGRTAQQFIFYIFMLPKQKKMKKQKTHRKFDYRPTKCLHIFCALSLPFWSVSLAHMYFHLPSWGTFFWPEYTFKLTHYVYVLDANTNAQPPCRRTFTHRWPKGQKSNLRNFHKGFPF